MNGILLVDKPKGWTSFDVVNYVRKIVAQSLGKKPKQLKVGHAGTLDPLATGLLVLLIGKEYTRRAPELTKLDKTYEATIRFGETSTTGDDEGEKTQVSDKKPSRLGIKSAFTKLTGEIMQTPPIYSAMKVDGQRAYKLAREGKGVKLKPRPVKIYRLELTKYSYPDAQFITHVSSGTYIRSLVEDIGQELKTGAYMTDLRRTQVGQFDIKDTQAVENLSAEIIYNNIQTLD